MLNGCSKYEQDPLNIVVCRGLTRAGRTDGRADRRRRSPQYPMAQMGLG